jgi:hypothetical protein
LCPSMSQVQANLKAESARSFAYGASFIISVNVTKDSNLNFPDKTY